MKIVDFHCDTISQLYDIRKSGESINLKQNRLHLDIEKMKKGDYMLQVFASYVDLGSNNKPLESCLSYIDLLYDEVEKNKEHIGIVYTYEDILTNIKKNKMSALLSIEEGGVCKGNLALLRNFYKLGVRMMTLTWNYENELAYPNGYFYDEEKNEKKGLKEKGFEFINEMERLGIIIDVSHLSDDGIYDVYNNTSKPFIASHSNAREVCSHQRNLTDDMIKKIGERGGLIGVNFYSSFLNNNYKSSDTSKIEDIINHIKYISNTGGIDCVGIGSDFDGIDCSLEFENSSKMQLIYGEMKKSGFREEDIEKVFYKNAIRLFKELL
ncbi:dipeptidase [Terrisporobacter petrolearius]|uniref:dipeptidase n=1 Tax=Terrisporobacter petrolearius TaxID=1460447 RepID=UPI001D162E97|nr:dipeptidase [Terrisporobacter petrolearius]MCC3863981.1 dipeptidase [Terrisporobacter petrolearius]